MYPAVHRTVAEACTAPFSPTPPSITASLHLAPRGVVQSSGSLAAGADHLVWELERTVVALLKSSLVTLSEEPKHHTGSIPLQRPLAAIPTEARRPGAAAHMSAVSACFGSSPVPRPQFDAAHAQRVLSVSAPDAAKDEPPYAS